MQYQKVRFSNHATSTDPEVCTAGIVLKSDQLRDMTVTDISRLYPMSEARKMRGVCQVSRKYDNYTDAFSHQFGIMD